MHTSLKHLALAAIAGGAMTFGSCNPDDDIAPVDPRDSNRAPTLTIENTDMSMTDGRVMVGEDDQGNSLNGSLFAFTLDGDDPDGNMRTLRVTRNGSNVSAGSQDVRIEFDGVVGPLSGNEPLLFGDDKRDFSKEVQVRAPQNFADSLTYAFIVTDTFGLSDTAIVTLVTGAAPTPLSTQVFRDRIFSNRSGPDRGALDLDTGEAVASTGNTDSELQDLGNNSQGQWLRQVQVENDAEMRVLVPATDDTGGAMAMTRFRNTTTVDGLLDLYDEAANDITTTETIVPGTIAIVRREIDGAEDKFFLVLFKAVNNTTDNNRDSYTVDIKQTDN